MLIVCVFAVPSISAACQHIIAAKLLMEFYEILHLEFYATLISVFQLFF